MLTDLAVLVDDFRDFVAVIIADCFLILYFSNNVYFYFYTTNIHNQNGIYI